MYVLMFWMCLIIHFLAFDISNNLMTVMGMGMVLWEWEGMGTEIVLPAHLYLGGRKRQKFGTIFNNFRLWSRISPERKDELDVMKIGKRGFLRAVQPPKLYFQSDLRRRAASSWALTIYNPSPPWAKNDELLSTNHKVIGAHIDRPKLICRNPIFWPPARFFRKCRARLLRA